VTPPESTGAIVGKESKELGGGVNVSGISAEKVGFAFLYLPRRYIKQKRWSNFNQEIRQINTKDEIYL
jgi:hypothetical protein